ncbi:MAG TPA: sugar phosphate isomerase/epimerase [Cyclobacteriaceae bacterium]|nr:sugar phosphate isomerase/epimerase [Cyclobacteriaceae bacterium]
MKDKDNTFSRRNFLAKSALAATGLVMANNSSFGFPAIIRNFGKPNSKFGGVQLGTITYSFRSMPTDAESVLKYLVDANISAIEMMGTTVEAFAGAPNASTEPMKPFVPGPRPELTDEQKAERAKRGKDAADWRASTSMAKFEQLRKMYKDAGVTIYAYKPNAFGPNNTDAEVDYGMRAAKALGATHITLEIPSEAGQTKRLSDIAAKNKILVAYHGHEQQTPTIWDAALAESKYNAMNCDLGHYTAAGFNAVELIEAKHDRIASAHLKDRQNPEHGKANLVWGTGDTPLVQILQTMRKNKYKFPGTIELEYEVPAGSDPVKEVAKCVEFCRKALETV